MQGAPITIPDPVTLSAATQPRDDNQRQAQTDASAEASAVSAGQAVASVSQGARRLIDIFV